MEQRAQGAEDQTAYQRTVETESRTSRYRFIIFASKRPAHHAGRTDAEQIVYRIESEQNRSGEGHCSIFYRISQHSDKISVRHVVKHHDQGTEDHGDGQFCDCGGDRCALEEHGLVILLH